MSKFSFQTVQDGYIIYDEQGNKVKAQHIIAKLDHYLNLLKIMDYDTWDEEGMYLMRLYHRHFIFDTNIIKNVSASDKYSFDELLGIIKKQND